MGKRYWNRSGGITAPIQRALGGDARFPYTDGFNLYSVYGSLGSDHSFSRANLVAEYTGPELKMPLTVEVGKRYVDKGGWITSPVTSVDLDGRYTCAPAASGSTSFLVREFLGKDDPICNM